MSRSLVQTKIKNSGYLHQLVQRNISDLRITWITVMRLKIALRFSHNLLFLCLCKGRSFLCRIHHKSRLFFSDLNNIISLNHPTIYVHQSQISVISSIPKLPYPTISQEYLINNPPQKYEQQHSYPYPNRSIRYIYISCMSRYQNYCQQDPKDEASLTKRTGFFSQQPAKGCNGNTWDAKHMSDFLNNSNYSNWSNQPHTTSRSNSTNQHRYSSSHGDYFFRTTKDDKNVSKIGCTPIFPLVTNIETQPIKQISLRKFFQSIPVRKEGRPINGRSIKLMCNPEDNFKFEGNASKFIETDPITLRHEENPAQIVNGYLKQRMNRLIDRRHPHGITGVDHPQNPGSTLYNLYQQKIRVREEPNSHQTFTFNRDWNCKKRSLPPVDHWKQRKVTTIRQFRNDNIHGYNILTNRSTQQ